MRLKLSKKPKTGDTLTIGSYTVTFTETDDYLCFDVEEKQVSETLTDAQSYFIKDGKPA